MTRRLLTVVVAALLVTLCAGELWAQGILTQVVDNGPRSRRLNLVFLGDGYTAAEQAKFDDDIVDVYQAMLTEPPFSDYTAMYNVFSIFVASNESGVDSPDQSVYRDTYFNGTYYTYGIPRLTSIPPNDYDGNYNNGAGRVYSLLSMHVPEYDMVVILFNDPRYGGSGGQFAISSTHELAPRIVMHELGHSFAGLEDEYDSETPGYSGREGFNTTAATTFEECRWNHWIEPETPLPTPEIPNYYSDVGLIEGACYEKHDWYRPMFDCKMKSLGASFCSVCTEQLIKAEYSFLDMIDATSPVDSVVPIVDLDSATFEIQLIDPDYPYLDIVWSIDGVPVSGAEEVSLRLFAPDLGSDTFLLAVVVRDTTPNVRNDPSGLLMESRSWLLDVQTREFCCTQSSGNADNDDLGIVDLSDVLYMANAVFLGGEGFACPAAANIDGGPDCTIDLSDILWLAGAVFLGGDPAAACLAECQ